MGLEVAIRDQVRLEVDEGVEIGLVVAVVESVGESNLSYTPRAMIIPVGLAPTSNARINMCLTSRDRTRARTRVRHNQRYYDEGNRYREMTNIKTHQHRNVLGDLQYLATVDDRLLKLRPLEA